MCNSRLLDIFYGYEEGSGYFVMYMCARKCRWLEFICPWGTFVDNLETEEDAIAIAKILGRKHKVHVYNWHDIEYDLEIDLENPDKGWN